MRVCLVSHAYFERGYRPALQAMANQPGVTLALITPARYTLGLQTSSPDFDQTGLSCHVYALPIRLGGRQGTFFYEPLTLARALDDFRPDVILHEQEVFALGAGELAFFARRRSIPLVHFVWENLDRSLARPRRWLRQYVFRRTTALITGSTQAAEMHHRAGFRGPTIVLLQSGVDSNPSPALGRRAGATLHVCFAGSLILRKGVDCLLRGVAEAVARGIPLRCSIAGDGPERASLEALARSLSIEEKVTFLGAIPMHEVTGLLQRSDVLALPSRRTPAWEEQFGRILVEAMAQGTVTVGSRTGAIPEVIGAEALLFAENDHTGLAEVLMHLDQDRIFFTEQQRSLWQRARDEYSFEVVAERKIAFLKQIWMDSKRQPVVSSGSPGHASRAAGKA